MCYSFIIFNNNSILYNQLMKIYLKIASGNEMSEEQLACFIRADGILKVTVVVPGSLGVQY